jgi:hypothetical protein
VRNSCMGTCDAVPITDAASGKSFRPGEGSRLPLAGQRRLLHAIGVSEG